MSCEAGASGRLVLTVQGLPRNPGDVVTVEAYPPDRPLPLLLAEFEADEDGFIRTVVADLAGEAEGPVTLRAQMGPSGGPPYASIDYEGFLDHSPPAAEWLEPAEDETVCAAPAPQPAVLAFRTQANDHAETLDVSAELLDESGARALVPACSDSPGEPCHQTTGPPDTTHWALADQPSGRYTARLTYCDGAGNPTVLDRRFTLAREAPSLRLKTQSSSLISPNGDGQADQAVLVLLSTQRLTVTATVKSDGNDAVLRTILGADFEAGDIPVVWDGRNEAGGIVPDGRYSIETTGHDRCGRFIRTVSPIAVDTRPPTVAIVAPLGGSTVAASVDVRGDVDDAHLKSWQLEYRPGPEPTSWRVLCTGTRAIQGGLLCRFDVPASEGPHTVVLVAMDAAGNRAETPPVVVTSREGDVLRRLAATPALFSPNGDGRRETTTLEYEIGAPAKVFLEVRDAQAHVLRTIENGVSRPAGSYAQPWDGRTDAETLAPEGEHVLWIRVEEAGGAVQEETIAIALDRTAPVLVVAAPAAEEVVTPERPVRGTVNDPNLAAYAVTVTAADGSVVELGGGAQPRANADLALLSSLSDGPYMLSVSAADAAENRVLLERSFTVDSIAPAVSILAPLPGAVLPRGPEPATLLGSVLDLNLASYTLGFGAGADPSVLVELAQGTSGGPGLSWPWPVAAVPDGLYTLVLSASDRAGHSTTTRAQATLDSVDPLARVDSPGEGDAINQSRAILGAASDAHLASWTLEASPGEAASAFQWATLASGTDEVAGAFASWVPLPPDGVHTLRLTVQDRAGHTSTVLRTVTVDTTPPTPPGALAATVERQEGTLATVRLTWVASLAEDVAGYRVWRDDQEITSSLLLTPAFLDARLQEGSFRYRVAAVDRAGNVSTPATLTVRVDVTPPLVDLQRPLAGAPLSGSVDVVGTAYSPSDFKEYRLLVGSGADPTSWTTLKRSSVPVAAGFLGTWAATTAGPHVLALEAEDQNGNLARTTVGVIVDTEPPAAPILLPVAADPEHATSLVVSWQASPSLDVAGTLVFRDGRVAGAPGEALGDLRRRLVPGSTYTDLDLPDGRHCYRIHAMDLAGNLSLPSEEQCQRLDNQAPRAVDRPPRRQHALRGRPPPAGGEPRHGRRLRAVPDRPRRDLVLGKRERAALARAVRDGAAHRVPRAGPLLDSCGGDGRGGPRGFGTSRYRRHLRRRHAAPAPPGSGRARRRNGGPALLAGEPGVRFRGVPALPGWRVGPQQARPVADRHGRPAGRPLRVHPDRGGPRRQRERSQ